MEENNGLYFGGSLFSEYLYMDLTPYHINENDISEVDDEEDPLTAYVESGYFEKALDGYAEHVGDHSEDLDEPAEDTDSAMLTQITNALPDSSTRNQAEALSQTAEEMSSVLPGQPMS